MPAPSTLTASERQDRILSLLREQGHASVTDLSDRLEVSAVTIRKDLRTLETQGLLYRTHGGAYLRNPYVTDRPVSEKASIRAAEKDRIGRAAAAHAPPQGSIVIASGTTTAAVARHLPATARGLTVVTSAMNVALELARHAGIETLLLGGMVRASSASVVGPQAEAVLRDTTCDTLFLGVDGFDLAYGLTTTSALEASLNRAMIAASQRVIVVADASKFGRRGFSRICGTDVVDRVITDDAIDPAVVAALEEEGVEVEVV